MSILIGATAWLALLGATQEATTKTRFTDSRTKVEVVLEVHEHMFPKNWEEKPINAEAVVLDPNEIDRSATLAKTALATYPAAVLKKDLKRLYVNRSIKFYDLEYGGTNSLDTVYLTNDGPKKGYTDSYVIGSFHHELSSIFLRNHPTFLDKDAWLAANPTDFEYGAGGTEALRSGKSSTNLDDKLAEQGFAAQYAQASMEEDFNMTVEGMFSGKADFWKAVDAHTRLKSKVHLIVKFYGKLDPSFTEAFFRAIKPANDVRE